MVVIHRPKLGARTGMFGRSKVGVADPELVSYNDISKLADINTSANCCAGDIINLIKDRVYHIASALARH